MDGHDVLRTLCASRLDPGSLDLGQCICPGAVPKAADPARAEASCYADGRESFNEDCSAEEVCAASSGAEGRGDAEKAGAQNAPGNEKWFQVTRQSTRSPAGMHGQNMASG